MDSFSTWHPTFPVNLSNCEEEPIHIPGAVQPFGILLAFAKDSGLLKVYSSNVLNMFQISETDYQKYELDHFIGIEGNDIPVNSLKNNRTLLRMRIKGNNQLYFGVRYLSGDYVVYELDLHSDATVTSSALDYLSDLPVMMNDVFGHEDLQSLMNFSASKVKELTGFDRVMIYRYDHNYDGEVVAEAKEPHLESYLNLHYPASDVPPQARLLYIKNWTRIIPDVDYRPSLIQPASEQRIDLSDSMIRSVSPIHIEYLKNMGVHASMSISLIENGKLWGLIACHHYAGAHFIPVNVRISCESYGQLISSKIKALQTSDSLERSKLGEKRLQSVVATMSEDHFLSHIQGLKSEFFELFKCSGMIIRLGEERHQMGDVPDEKTCLEVALKLQNKSVFEPLVTDELGSLLENNLADKSRFAGIMALSLSHRHNYYIICVRPEVKQKYNWAGDPHMKNSMDFKNPKDRLKPRGSFALWEETYEGRSESWENETIEIFKKFALLFVKIAIDRKEIAEKSNAELQALNQAKDEFVATVSHELRTPLNSIIGWTELALSQELNADRIPDALKIIQRNARSQNQLINDLLDVSRIISGKMKLSVRSMRVSEVVDGVVLSFRPAADAKEIKIIAHTDEDSDSIIGDSQRIQQVVWNLISNAVKFSKKKSRIWVFVRRVNSHVELEIKDQGQGLADEDLARIFGRFEQVDSSLSRQHGGLGLGLAISKHIVELHGGEIRAESEGLGTGSSFLVRFPISPLKPSSEMDLPIDDDHSAVDLIDASFLSGLTILVVEDEPDAQNFLSLLLEGHGAKVLSANDGVLALETLVKVSDSIDIVLSDVGMPNMDGYELMKKIRTSSNPKIKNICAIALTAFARPLDRINALKAGFDSYISKPVMQEELLTVLKSSCQSKTRQER